MVKLARRLSILLMHGATQVPQASSVGFAVRAARPRVVFTQALEDRLSAAFWQ